MLALMPSSSGNGADSVTRAAEQVRDAIPRAVAEAEDIAARFCRRELWARHKFAIIGGALLLVAVGILLARRS